MPKVLPGEASGLLLHLLFPTSLQTLDLVPRKNHPVPTPARPFHSRRVFPSQGPCRRLGVRDGGGSQDTQEQLPRMDTAAGHRDQQLDTRTAGTAARPGQRWNVRAVRGSPLSAHHQHQLHARCSWALPGLLSPLPGRGAPPGAELLPHGTGRT